MRTFLAVDISDDIREAISHFIEELKERGDGVKWVSSENIHVTISFFGEVNEVALKIIIGSTKEAALRVRDFSMAVRSFSAFPSKTNPRVLWLGVEDGGALERLYDAVSSGTAGIGEEKRGRYTPHLTIGRVRRGRSPGRAVLTALNERGDTDFGKCGISETVLYESVLGRQGPRYSVLERFPLGHGVK